MTLNAVVKIRAHVVASLVLCQKNLGIVFSLRFSWAVYNDESNFIDMVTVTEE